MKRFLYLVQVERDLPRHLTRLDSGDSDVRFVSWKSRSADPRSAFYPHSSWTEGRNRLYKEIAGTGYQYYIFLDDDVLMRMPGGSARDPWRAFEDFLLDYEPAVGVPRYMWHLQSGGLDLRQPVQGIRFFDALFNAFHRDAVHALLPYCDRLDHFSEAYSQSILCSTAAMLYKNHLLQYNGVEVVNLESRRAEREYLYCRAEDYFLASMRDPGAYADFLRLKKGRFSRHDPFGEPSRKAQHSYLIPAADLERRFTTTHPLWAHRMELIALPKDSEFFSDSPDTERARRWQAEKASRLAAPPGLRRPRRPREVALDVVRWCLLNSALLRRLNASRKAVYTRIQRRRIAAAQRRLTLTPFDRDSAAQWDEWRRAPEMVFEFPNASAAFHPVALVLSRIAAPHLTMIDAAGLREDIVRVVVAAMPLQPIVSIAIHPTAHADYLNYGEFAIAAVADGPEDPSVPRYRLATLIRQFGLDRDVLHLILIDGQASNLDACVSLGAHAARCLFLCVTMPIADRANVEALGFRLFATAARGADRDPDLIFVNVGLMARVVPD